VTVWAKELHPAAVRRRAFHIADSIFGGEGRDGLLGDFDGPRELREFGNPKLHPASRASGGFSGLFRVTMDLVSVRTEESDYHGV
jgi:hypothetical protein